MADSSASFVLKNGLIHDARDLIWITSSNVHRSTWPWASYVRCSCSNSNNCDFSVALLHCPFSKRHALVGLEHIIVDLDAVEALICPHQFGHQRGARHLEVRRVEKNRGRLGSRPRFHTDAFHRSCACWLRATGAFAPAPTAGTSYAVTDLLQQLVARHHVLSNILWHHEGCQLYSELHSRLARAAG